MQATEGDLHPSFHRVKRHSDGPAAHLRGRSGKRESQMLQSQPGLPPKGRGTGHSHRDMMLLLLTPNDMLLLTATEI